MDDIQDLFKETVAEFMEDGLEAELDEELGYSRYDYRNKETDISQDIEEKILSMYAKGMTTGDIEAHIQDRKRLTSGLILMYNFRQQQRKNIRPAKQRMDSYVIQRCAKRGFSLF